MRVQSLLTRLGGLRDGLDAIGMPSVYQLPDIVRAEERVVRPSAARDPGRGMLGMLVRTVRRSGS